MDLANHSQDLLQRGYTIITFPDPAPIQSMTEAVFGNIADHFNESDSAELGFLKDKVLSDEEWLSVLGDLNEKSIDVSKFKAICDQIRPIITSFIGENVACEISPRVRFSLPGEARTTLEMHSDTFYGNSFFEINLWILLSPHTHSPVLTLIPESHLPNLGEYAIKPGSQYWDSSSVRGKGLGIPYDPKTVNWNPEDTVNIQVPYGSALMFFGSILHGSCVIEDPLPRVSVDWRLTPMMLPREFRKTKLGSFQALYTTDVYKRILQCYPLSEEDYL